MLGLKLISAAVGISLLIGVFYASMYSWTHFRLWRAEYIGQALEIEKKYVGKSILAEAEHARLARVESARAEKESAQLTADAIKIVGEAAKSYPEYRNQEFILSFGEALRKGVIQQIMYVPTEAQIPITEAGKR